MHDTVTPYVLQYQLKRNLRPLAPNNPKTRQFSQHFARFRSISLALRSLYHKLSSLRPLAQPNRLCYKQNPNSNKKLDTKSQIG